jgi:hypothetical protein
LGLRRLSGGLGGCVLSSFFLSFLPPLFLLTASPAACPFPEQFDTFAKDIIIVPINLGGSHWVCAAVNFEKKRIEYYDSLGKARPAVYAVRPISYLHWTLRDGTDAMRWCRI